MDRGRIMSHLLAADAVARGAEYSKMLLEKAGFKKPR